ncbi:hypothetical protein [Neptunomonas japonica]|uniref:Uncharacterized protein n=1 Tax=Neptunomonas japonica JAMM 1380 TaxID=1441457 RepID=A0A7R6P9M5_9GAMM|nr:hypothetical protein [Neptunomonas japonica]BBB28404.1 conserved hypothetical protein [Neptunomonas japonica JAMM 1380]
MKLIITLIGIVLFLVYPVKFSAEKLGADNTGFGRCFFAVIASVFIGTFAESVGSSDLIQFVITLAGTAVVFSFLLGAKFVQSIIIALLSTLIQFGIIFGLIGLGVLSWAA